MLRKRLVTVLTINNGVLYRTRNFHPDYRYTLNFADAWDVDEVVLLDITRPGEGDRDHFYHIVNLFAENCFVPLAVGGGVRSLDDFRTMLSMGADKVVINTEAARNPDIISRAAQRFGSQCVVVSIDAKRNPDGGYDIYTDYGGKRLNKDLTEWAQEAQSLGAGEIMIQSIDHDGMLEGYDNELNKRVADAVEIPVLVCGGAGRWEHFVDGFNRGHAAAVCTTNIYHFTASSIHSAKEFLTEAGISTRPANDETSVIS